MILLLYCVTFLIISLWTYHSFVILFIFFHLSSLYTKDKPTLEDHLYISINNAPIPIYWKRMQVTFSEQNRPPPKHLSKIVNNNTTMNLNIASYFLNVLASPDISTWFTTGGPITKTIKNLGLTRHHQNTVHRTWHMFNMCKEVELQYTGKKIQSTLVNLTFFKSGWTQYSCVYDWKPSWPALHNPFHQFSSPPQIF